MQNTIAEEQLVAGAKELAVSRMNAETRTSWTGARLVDFDFLSNYYELEQDSRVPDAPELLASPPPEHGHRRAPRVKPWAPELEDGGRRLAATLVARKEKTGHFATFITGPAGGEGATTVSQLAAECLATGGHRVLLADANVSGGNLGLRYGLKSEPGLVDVQYGRANALEVIHSTSVTGLDVLLPGILRQHEGPTDAGLEELLLLWSQKYEFILFDVPAVLKSPVAKVLGPFVIDAVLVVKAHETRREVARKSLEVLQEAGVELVTTVLNRRTFPLPGWLYRIL